MKRSLVLSILLVLSANLVYSQKKDELFTPRNTNLDFKEIGPKSTPGSIRAIHIDINNDLHMFAGSRNGGLFESWDGGHVWDKVQSYPGCTVQSIAQSNVAPYRLIAGGKKQSETYGKSQELYESLDNGLTWQAIPGTLGFTAVNEILSVSGSDEFLIANSGGLYKYDGISFYKPANFPNNSNCISLAASNNNQLIIAAFSSNIQMSYDSGNSWTVLSSSDIQPASRTEFSISTSKANGQYHVCAATANSSFSGLFVSIQNGIPGSWQQAPPVLNNFCSQLTYGMDVTFSLNDPYQVILGICDLYIYKMLPGQSPANGQFQQKSFGGASQSSPIYLNENKHELVWNTNDELFIGCENGIYRTDADIDMFSPSHENLNTAEVYNFAYSRRGNVLAGINDYGVISNLNQGSPTPDFDLLIPSSYGAFTCDISHYSDSSFIASTVYGDIKRSFDQGLTWQHFYSQDLLSIGNPGSLGSFKVKGRLWETNHDSSSTDSISVTLNSNLSSGDTVWANSAMLELPIYTVLTQNKSAGATVKVQDICQNWYAFGLSSFSWYGGVWITRDAMRPNKTPFWWHIDSIGHIQDIEFSNDGNIMYAGNASGELYRIKGLNTLYANQYDQGFLNNDPSQTPGISVDRIFQGQGSISGVAVDPNDPNHVVVTMSGLGFPNLYRSVSAGIDMSTSGTGSFTDITGDIPGISVFDVMIDRDFENSGLLVIGTEYGPYATNDTTSWQWDYAGNTKLNCTPIFEVRQQWRGFNEGAYRPGEIYLGTFGRGVWSSESYLSASEEEFTGKTTINGLEIYPNPAEGTAHVVFDMPENSVVDCQIISISGATIHHKTLGYLSSGKHDISLALDQYSSGLYMIRLKTESRVISGKLMIK